MTGTAVEIIFHQILNACRIMKNDDSGAQWTEGIMRLGIS
jgi:hypothetical protein